MGQQGPNLGLHLVIGLVLPVRHVEFSEAFGLKYLDLFSESARRVHVLRSQRRMEMTVDLCKLNLLLINLAIAALTVAIPLRMSAEQNCSKVLETGHRL